IYGLPTILGRAFNYLLVPLYTRVFNPGEYGVVTELYAYVAFLYVLLLYGMETTFFRFSKTEEDGKTVFSTALISVAISSGIFLLLIIGASLPIASSMGYADNHEYIIWFALILAFDALCAIPFAHLRQKGKAAKFAFIKSINIFSNIGLNLFFILLCPWLLKNYGDSAFLSTVYDPQIGVGYVFISNLIVSALTLIILIPEIKGIRLRFEHGLWKQMFFYTWPLLILGFAGIVNETFDRIILKHLLPPESNPMAQLGIYGACYKVSILMTLFIQTYKYAAEPFFFEQMKNQEAKQLYANVMNYFVAICAFLFLVIMLFIDVTILLVGPEYRSGAPVIPILLMANLFLGIFYNLSVWFKITGKTLYGALIAVFGMLVTLVLNFALIPKMGYMGAAWATFICYGSMMVLSYLVGRKYYPIPYNMPRVSGYILLAVLLFFIGNLIPTGYPLIKALVNALLLGFYLVMVCWVEKPLSTLRRKA
ncbi:MAG: polysaccharide biosynthesis C-terminal domain-containing protein, partial [Bacteroidales bacterium]|nr:polysaccharide biosynthesis C-terminal domain-containing protein [Bacteroidales bacterium]